MTLIVPALVEFGFEPIAAHFFIFYYGVFSLITPPVAVAAMAAAGIAKSSPWETGVEACKMGIVAFIVPFVCVFSPSLLAQGPLWLVFVNFGSAACGVIAIAVALRGYFMREVGPAGRAAPFACALSLFLPVDAHEYVVGINIAALLAGGGDPRRQLSRGQGAALRRVTGTRTPWHNIGKTCGRP